MFSLCLGLVGIAKEYCRPICFEELTWQNASFVWNLGPLCSLVVDIVEGEELLEI